MGQAKAPARCGERTARSVIPSIVDAASRGYRVMILVCGEALIDLFVDAAEDKEMPARAVAGGSPFNVAIGLARLGVDSAFLGGISRDRFGALPRRHPRRRGRRRSLSGSHRSAVDDLGGRDRTTTASRATRFTARARRTVRSRSPICRLRCRRMCRALTFGSYTMVVEPVGSAFAALAERECGRRVISVDPNLRPAVVGDMARWATAAERFYRTATIIKASDEDMRVAWGGRVSVAEAAAYWLELRRPPGGGDRGSERGDGVLRQPAMFRCPLIPSWCAIRSAPATRSTPPCWRSWRKPTGSLPRRSPRSTCLRSATCSPTRWPPPRSPSRAAAPICRPRRMSKRALPRPCGSTAIPGSNREMRLHDQPSDPCGSVRSYRVRRDRRSRAAQAVAGAVSSRFRWPAA